MKRTRTMDIPYRKEEGLFSCLLCLSRRKKCAWCKPRSCVFKGGDYDGPQNHQPYTGEPVQNEMESNEQSGSEWESFQVDDDDDVPPLEDPRSVQEPQAEPWVVASTSTWQPSAPSSSTETLKMGPGNNSGMKIIGNSLPGPSPKEEEMRFFLEDSPHQKKYRKRSKMRPNFGSECSMTSSDEEVIRKLLIENMEPYDEGMYVGNMESRPPTPEEGNHVLEGMPIDEPPALKRSRTSAFLNSFFCGQNMSEVD